MVVKLGLRPPSPTSLHAARSGRPQLLPPTGAANHSHRRATLLPRAAAAARSRTARPTAEAEAAADARPLVGAGLPA